MLEPADDGAPPHETPPREAAGAGAGGADGAADEAQGKKKGGKKKGGRRGGKMHKKTGAKGDAARVETAEPDCVPEAIDATASSSIAAPTIAADSATTPPPPPVSAPLATLSSAPALCLPPAVGAAKVGPAACVRLQLVPQTGDDADSLVRANLLVTAAASEAPHHALPAGLLGSVKVLSEAEAPLKKFIEHQFIVDAPLASPVPSRPHSAGGDE
eukprot:7103720-Prymnesium_polylepis.1